MEKSARLLALPLLLAASVLAQPGRLTITSTTIPNGTIGVPYSQTIQAAGGVPPYTFSITPTTILSTSNPPPGLTLSSGGVFSGTPTRTGSFNFGVSVRDSQGTQAFAGYLMNIGTALVFTTASPLPSGVAGVRYSQNLFVTGGTAPYSFSIVDTPPPGLLMAASGALTGIPSSAGKFSFTVQAADSFGVTANNQYQVSFTAGPPSLQVSALALNFDANAGGDAAPAQSIAIVSTGLTAINYSVRVDSGAGTGAAPSWITVKTVGNATPGRITVTADPGSLQAGIYPAGIHITVPNDLSQNPIDISVTFRISATGPQLEAFPSLLKFAARSQVTAQLTQSVMLHNSAGGGGLPFTVTVAGKSGWITSVLPGGGQTVADSVSVIQVQVNSAGLAVGRYRDVLQISWLGGILQIPVVLFVSDQGPILDLGVKGVRIPAIAGNFAVSPASVNVLNRGDASAAMTWTADLQSGSDWLTLGRGGITTNAGTPQVAGFVTLQPSTNVANLSPGPRYALVRVVSPQALNSPQYLTAVLDVAPASTAPKVEVQGFAVASAPAGSRQPLTQNFSLQASSNGPITFQASASTTDGTPWLSVNPTPGSVASTGVHSLNLVFDPSNLTGGIYSGEVDIATGSQVTTISVTFVITNLTFAVCTPSRIVVTPVGLTTHFSVPAGWPAVLSALVTDDCGGMVTGASVFASFSDGDPAVAMLPDGSGAYSAAWAPGTAAQQMNVTLRAVSGGLLPASATLIGDVLQNNVPTLAANGTLNNLNALIGGALSPGDVVQVFGTNLATGTGSTGSVPLVTSFNGSDLRIGGVDAPLYYVSGPQLTAQIPAELAANRQYSVIGIVNGALTLPDTIDLNPVAPGVATFADGTLIVQHSDFSLVTDQNPAHRGETLTMYLVGLGATNPPVGSGRPAPGLEPFARPLIAPSVTVDNQPAQIGFAGMTPFGVGLFQINFQVPQTARTGVPLNVVVTQGSVAANTTRLTVVP